MEDGGQPTINNLREINLGTEEELRNTFISIGLFVQEVEKYAKLLKENEDVFAWTFTEMPDDLVVKLGNHQEHHEHLASKKQLKMNPAKCTFGVSSGKFFDFIIRHRGIEMDPGKVKAIQNMPLPKTLKELKKFVWDKDCQNAFDSMKELLKQPPVLTTLIKVKPLILYISAAENSLGALLA
ncbi:uncharacterized protein LOC131228789 [Magnolia sinica]|uniref:uncharacterized protein LOC131228789 n=1 Tax=Magnolia sinica TaxID=86752 RepID=UPI00265ACD0E|nr:uncharacterized protein LOC131228789 [Magnolia sinica]